MAENSGSCRKTLRILERYVLARLASEPKYQTIFRKYLDVDAYMIEIEKDTEYLLITTPMLYKCSHRVHNSQTFTELLEELRQFARLELQLDLYLKSFQDYIQRLFSPMSISWKSITLACEWVKLAIGERMVERDEPMSKDLVRVLGNEILNCKIEDELKIEDWMETVGLTLL